MIFSNPPDICWDWQWSHRSRWHSEVVREDQGEWTHSDGYHRRQWWNWCWWKEKDKSCCNERQDNWIDGTIKWTYCNESWRSCLRARTYIMLATRPTARTRPKAQAAALIRAGPWEGAWAGAGDWFGSGEMPIMVNWKMEMGNGKWQWWPVRGLVKEESYPWHKSWCVWNVAECHWTEEVLGLPY